MIKRISSGSPKKQIPHRGICFFIAGDSNNVNATVRWTVAADGWTEANTVKFRFIELFPIGIVGAIINRPPNYLQANNWISEGNQTLSPTGDGILFCKIPGRIISAPTNSNEHLIDKSEFEDVSIPSTPNGVTIIAALCTHCPPALPADKLEFEWQKIVI